ncbi:hypothetical protein MK805_06655 [Shimazuella sp. AN120528]|nr:hypothetical protein [Shimazuella soli]MCH5584649.1 hypothetical protein [Shimazuella soli]
MFESFFSNLLKWNIWVGALVTFIIPVGIQKIYDLLNASLNDSTSE